MVQDNDNVVLLINEEEECMHLAGVESKWVVDTTTSYHRLANGALVIAKGVAHGMLYRTNAEICQDELNVAHEEISVDFEIGTADDLSKKDKKKNGIVPNLVTIPSSFNHPISAESTIDEPKEEEQSEPLSRSERQRVESSKYPSSDFPQKSNVGKL
ncbi:hypothetical protein R3W88_031984 [Solanum pinnatisectum]|uniref:Uncharacterized protein n=1 Tax=Solanum pinnatisectum TaxID=50273 RepID=A0AAV9LP83_9SOLN|nr:hypothetical protein R3W88_031984 [Solanum pinnatisectum]